MRVLPGTFDDRGHGFALKEGSALRESANRALLEHIASDAWRATLAHHLGAVP